MTRVEDRGSVSLEMAILAPLVIALIVTGLIAGGHTLASNAVDLAAHDASRAASISRTAAEATTRAHAAAEETLDDQNIGCVTLDVAVDTTGFSIPVGQPANVTVEITCRLDFTDIALPGMPTNVTITKAFTSALDTYRSRQ